MVNDWPFSGQVKHVTEAGLETQQLAVNGKAPAINPMHGIDTADDRLDVQRFFMQGNA